jgi:8-oxo-dGTP diphosphatase
VDVALVTVTASRLAVVVHRRPGEPFANEWALPGVFVQPDEELAVAARRAIADKAGVDDVFVEQLFTFGAPGRDPRGRVISVAHYALVPEATLTAALATRGDAGVALAGIEGSDPAGSVRTTIAGEPVELAFDHGEIVSLAVERLRGKVGYAPLGYELLPELFTLRDLRVVHEAILGRPLNKDSFRRTLLESGQIEPTGEREAGVRNRPAELYRARRDGP